MGTGKNFGNFAGCQDASPWTGDDSLKYINKKNRFAKFIELYFIPFLSCPLIITSTDEKKVIKPHG